MNTPYALLVELAQPMAEATAVLRAALAAEQMGIVSEVDLQASLKAQLGVDTPPQRLLGVCSPRVVHVLTRAEPDIAALLPCGCAVSEPVPGLTRIAMQDPRLIGAATNNPEVRAACELARAALRRVADRLAFPSSTLSAQESLP
ncbi:MAG: DUF302 domain-containing protein [Burkholderiales bacterium]|nr:DUF302 domain-containing protein [Burkholderiales bacterium]MBP7520615.1 DUF302 domain-containing protein [Leptothrix sp. (in: b-proteobacteria)]HQY07380.1 DUF302 domain-containing protein [Burkholderiaceae bacterium]